MEERKLDEAETLLKESLAARLKDLEKQRELAASDAFELGGIQKLKLDYTGAREYYRQAVELDSDNSIYLNEYGVIEDRLGRYKEAIGLYEQALAIDREVSSGENHSSVATDLNNLGVAWGALGDYQKAVGLFKQVLAILTDVLGPEHPIIQTVADNLQQAQEKAGE